MIIVTIARRLLRDESGSAAIEYAVNFAAAVLIAIAGLALTYGMVQATYLTAEARLADTSRTPVLCAGQVRSSATGGEC